MANIRQSILLRTDLNLPKGLAEAQVAHIHFEMFRRRMMCGVNSLEGDRYTKVILTDAMWEWLKFPYTFVHGVPNIEVLDEFIKKVKEKDILMSEWRDTIYIEISKTQKIVVENCLVGMAMLGESDKIKAVIGDLPLLG